jgi:putative ABC transport system permease protein
VGNPVRAPGDRPTATLDIVSASFFETLDSPLVAGRAFDERDTRQAVQVCIVNEAFVRLHVRDRSPLGARVRLRLASAPPDSPPAVCEIVGVARQMKVRPDETEQAVQVYAPITQLITDDIYLLVGAAAGRASALAGPVRTAIGRIDTERLTSVRNLVTLDEVAWEATARYRFRAVLVGTFAGLALLLAMVGVFGVLAYSVQQRVREIGLRRALGATTAEVLRLVAMTGTRVVGIGVGIGLALSMAGAQLLTTMLFGVRPLDPVTFLGVCAMLFATAVAAVAAPAWRAVRIDPAVALRAD